MKKFYLAFLLFLPLLLKAQVNDAQLWENVSVNKKITHLWDFHFNHEGRISDNITHFNYAYGDFGLSYKLTKWFKLSGDYVLLWKKGTSRESIKHQWYFDYAIKLKLKPFEFEWRNMLQQEVQNVYSSSVGKVITNYLRNKFTIKYHPEKYPWYRFAPYLAVEAYYHLDNNDKYGRQFDRIRYFAGVFYIFNKKTEMELYYLYEDNFNTNNPAKNFVYGIGFSREL